MTEEKRGHTTEMMTIEEKFAKLEMENAPGQEGKRAGEVPVLEGYHGPFIDFGHGDTKAFEPIPGHLDRFIEGLGYGSDQAYTPYAGKPDIVEYVAGKLSDLTGTAVDPAKNVILTPGTQGALFLAMGALVMPGDKVVIAQPDYFAYHKLVEFLQGELVPTELRYKETRDGIGIDLAGLEERFAAGAKVFMFSNPNNPTGAVYSGKEIAGIARLAKKYGVALIVDSLYARQIFEGVSYHFLCAEEERPEKIVTIIGPSKTESLSGYRLGVAFGTPEIIERMQKLQGIVSLRCAGYNQSVFLSWFREPEGWLAGRLAEYTRIRDDLVALCEKHEGVSARPTDGGSYIFFEMPELTVPIREFTRICEKNADTIVTPGTEFGPQFTHHFRINFQQDHDVCIDAVDRVLKIMELYRK